MKAVHSVVRVVYRRMRGKIGLIAFRIPHSAFRIPHSAFRIPHSPIRTICARAAFCADASRRRAVCLANRRDPICL
jgi:hypothetical protein